MKKIYFLLLLLGSPLALLCLLMFYSILWLLSIVDKIPCVGGTLSLFLMLLLVLPYPIVLIYHLNFLSLISEKIVIYEHGFLIKKPRSTRYVLWTEISELYYRFENGANIYYLQFASGEEVRFNMMASLNELKQALIKRQIPVSKKSRHFYNGIDEVKK